MEIRDFNLIEYKNLKLKIGKQTYDITQVPGMIELELLRNQNETMEKLKAYNIDDKDLIKWRSMLKRLLKANNEYVEDSDIDTLDPIKCIGFINMIYFELVGKMEKVRKLYDIPEIIEEEEKKKMTD